MARWHHVPFSNCGDKNGTKHENDACSDPRKPNLTSRFRGPTLGVHLSKCVKPVLSRHAEREMDRRGIPLAVVQSVLDVPAQIVPEHGDVVCYPSQVEINGKPYLVRVMVNNEVSPPKVVTAYRTSKINKYWQTT